MRRHNNILNYLLVSCFVVIICLFGAGCSGISILGQMNQGDNRITRTDGELEVHFIDVGQGDATLIKEGSHAMLIDAGENNQGTAVAEYLESQNVQELDYVIGTHPDSDHIGGLDVVIAEYPCDKVIMPGIASDTKTYGDVLLALEDKGLTMTEPVVGDTYALGKASFTVIAPNRDYGDDTNNWSAGIILTYGKNRFLFTGDAEETAEKDIVSNGIDISADVYKAAHHGSKTGSSDALLDAVQPVYSVISCGEDNEYGHPNAQTLNSFRSRGIKVFRTDEQGTIVAVSDGTQIVWNMSPDDSWKSGEAKGSSQKNNTKVRYVLNTNTKKYHRPSCAHVDEIKKENREDTTATKNQLEKQGYQPCGTCKP
ncbi:MAG: ComEC/Rec2 family competence protein [Anaerobutyricum sp.]|nr:MBL fold metallo-hydrolase [Eubacterium sp.]MDY6047533.1 ComEC/Rec2 family competence protein [Anaerobutyricum sp.]